MEGEDRSVDPMQALGGGAVVNRPLLQAGVRRVRPVVIRRSWRPATASISRSMAIFGTSHVLFSPFRIHSPEAGTRCVTRGLRKRSLSAFSRTKDPREPLVAPGAVLGAAAGARLGAAERHLTVARAGDREAIAAGLRVDGDRVRILLGVDGEIGPLKRVLDLGEVLGRGPLVAAAVVGAVGLDGGLRGCGPRSGPGCRRR